MKNEEPFSPSTVERTRLRVDIPPIVVQSEHPPDDLPDTLWLDYDDGEDAEKGIMGAGPDSYVISPISKQNLFSNKYINCTGALGIGQDKISGEQVAFISHQDPEFLLHKGTEASAKFLTDMKATLNDLVTRSEENTVEVVLFGGNDDPMDPASKKTVDYKKSIEMLKRSVQDVLGYEPVIIDGPNHLAGAIDITVSVKERKIFIGR